MTTEDLTALNSIRDDLSRLVIADYFADKDMTWVEQELRVVVPGDESDGYFFNGDGGGGFYPNGDGGGGLGSNGDGGGDGCGSGANINISDFQRFML